MNKLQIRDARGICIGEKHPQDWIILSKSAECPLFILFSSSSMNYLNPKYLGHLGLKC